MVDMPETDGQDVAEAFDEDNTNIEGRRQGRAEDAEQFEDIPDVYDVTSKVGDRDDDDDEAEIGEDMDDDEIVSEARDHNDDDDDPEDDDLKAREGEGPSAEDPADENDLGPDDPDLVDDIDKTDPNEVELSYQGDLTDVAGASSSAADMESDKLSDQDLRDLHYKD